MLHPKTNKLAKQNKQMKQNKQQPRKEEQNKATTDKDQGKADGSVDDWMPVLPMHQRECPHSRY